MSTGRELSLKFLILPFRRESIIICGWDLHQNVLSIKTVSISPGRWYWDYGNGLMTDWGVHLIDYILYGMGKTIPASVMAIGGKYAFPDDAYGYSGYYDRRL